MKYCMHCGAQLYDEAVVCVKCGRSVEVAKPVAHTFSDESDTLITVIKVFLIIGCISQGWILVPLAWCLPITISIFNSFRDHRPISTGLKVCTLLFVNMIAGICLLCLDDKKY